MKQKTIKEGIILISLLLFMAIILVSCDYYSLRGHEEAHKQINEKFGALSHIEINYLGSSKTIVDSNFESPEAKQNAYIVHGINEAIGYQLRPLFQGILLMLMFIGSFLIIICYLLYNIFVMKLEVKE